MQRIAVLDIGKTNAKVLVVDLAPGAEEVLARTPDTVVRDGPYPHHDPEMPWGFALSGLKLAAERGGLRRGCCPRCCRGRCRPMR